MLKVKENTVVVGFNEAPFQKNDDQCRLLGCVYRGGRLMEELLSGMIKVDGDDANDMIIRLVNGSKCFDQIKVIMIGSLALAGFNLVDLNRIYQELGIPAVSVIRRKPDQEAIKELLVKLKMKEKIIFLDLAGEIHEDYGIFFQMSKGITYDQVTDILEMTMTEADYPEALRMAKIIGRGLI